MSIKVTSKAYPSIHKEVSEDSFLVDLDNNLFVICDGVSSSKGEMASNFVIQKIKDALLKNPLSNEIEEARDELKNLITQIDKLLKEENDKLGTRSTTTLTLIHISQDKAISINIGDSRTYLHRDEKSELITEDADCLSLRENMNDYPEIELKEIPEEKRIELRRKLDELPDPSKLDLLEYWLIKHRGVVTNIMGRGRAKINIRILEIKKGDRLLLTSDGVHDNLSFSQIQTLLNQNKIEILVNKAREFSYPNMLRYGPDDLSSPDDITAILVEVN